MMRVRVDVPCKGYASIAEDVVRLFFPSAELLRRAGEECGKECAGDSFRIRIEVEENKGQGTVRCCWEPPPGPVAAALAEGNGNSPGSDGLAVPAWGTGWEETWSFDFSSLPAAERENEKKRAVKLCVYRLLCCLRGGVPSPWGILTGVRPVKIVHRLIEKGYGREKVLEVLQKDYAVAPEKAALLWEVADCQRPFLLPMSALKRVASVYVGIPFCPTRCLYCSFPGYPLARWEKWTEPFLSALLREIEEVGREMRSLEWKVQSIYIGGGTPTCLGERETAAFLAAVREWFWDSETAEFTVEGGRPETLTAEKLALLKEYGVSRLSINPQSMQDKTLRLIGRSHSARDIMEAVERARRFGFATLNMDVIVGLPGETAAEVFSTMEEIKKLRPENLTVHTMAVKRASQLKEEYSRWELPAAEEVNAMLEITRAAAREMGMRPYYLYRLKRILGNLENVGYSLPGHESCYNIQMIEERQTVVGLGGGAGSKWFAPETGALAGSYNPKDPINYVERVEELIERKKAFLRQLSA